MPPKRSLNRKRQTKINFSPAEKPSPRATRVLISSDDEESSPSRPAKRRRLQEQTDRGMKLGMPVQQQARGMFGSSDNEINISSGNSSEDDSSEDEIQVVTPKSAQRRPKPVEESDEEEVQPRSNRRRRAARQPSTPQEESENGEQNGEDEEDGDSDDEEKDELKEDLAFLRSSPLPDRGRLRSTNTKPKSEREKALEALKKRRGATNEPSSSATPGRKKPVVVDESDSDLEVIEEEQIGGDVDDEIEDGDEEEQKEAEDSDQGHETNALDVFQENVDDENFIDDEDALIGAPSEHTNIPLQFSSLSRAKPRELFKYAVEWMVKKKINPAFASNDEIYDLTFRKLDDEVNGLASSKFHSSVWTADFTRAIKARPDLLVNEIGKHIRAIMEPHCEACNRKSHIASWEVSLTGAPYHKETLEPLADNSDSDSDSNSDASLSSEAELNGEKPTYNSNGERLPPEEKIFTLGSTCKANAQVAHTLYHWRYHLNSWVVDYLVRQGHCTAEQLLKRDKWSVRKREKLANKIVDQMEEEGEIRKLHRLYKEQVDFALEARNDYHRGWGRTRG